MSYGREKLRARGLNRPEARKSASVPTFEGILDLDSDPADRITHYIEYQTYRYRLSTESYAEKEPVADDIRDAVQKYRARFPTQPLSLNLSGIVD